MFDVNNKLLPQHIWNYTTFVLLIHINKKGNNEENNASDSSFGVSGDVLPHCMRP